MSNFDEPAECPLCMEPLEMDDVNFFPCTCGYQICRFCWHRIRTDENGLCPACRKAYPECPADIKPLSEEQLHRIKNEKRQKDIQRKQKITENRKHLASVRVVQKNLVFVVGLSQRLADTEILKKQEYFGKFGKILKVVINQNTSYAGSQSHGPSASAYVTYQRAEDSLRAIQAVNNVHVDGRTLKASLGTTKYCSHFLRNSQCPKLDCMYLHELGDENASFTKEDMQMGKHQEYEQKLLHDLLGGGSSHSPGSSTTNTTTHNHTAATTASTSATTNSTSAASNSASNAATSSGGERSRSQSNTRKKQPSPPTTQKSHSRGSPSIATDSWPSLSKTNATEGGDEPTNTQGEESQSTINSHTTKETISDIVDRTDALPPLIPPSTNGLTTDVHENSSHPHNSAAPPIDIPKKRVISETGSLHSTPREASPQVQSIPDLAPPPVTDTRQAPLPGPTGPPPNLPHPGRGAPFGDIAHLFGGNGFIPQANLQRHIPAVPIPGMPQQNEWNNSGWTAGSELLPVDSQTTDWQAAFGFASDPKDKHNEDDLGFDPWQESSQGLADLLEKELQLNQPTKITQPPPGFNNHSQPFVPLHRHGRPAGRSKILPWVHSQSPPTSEAPPSGQTGSAQPPPPANHVPRFPAPPRSSMPAAHSPHSPNPLTDNVHLKTWQDGLRALLPNINISFGQSQQPPQSFGPEMSRVSALQNTGDSWVGSPTGSSWAVQDPAIVSIRSSLPNSAETNNTEGRSLLQFAHWRKHTSLLKDDQENTALHLIAQGGHLDTAKAIIKKDDVVLDERNSYGQTPLHLAIREGHKQMTKLLLKTDKSLAGIHDSNAMTPLMYACQKGDPFIVELLLEQNQDEIKFSDCDQNGLNCLDHAINNCQEMVAVQLLSQENWRKLMTHSTNEGDSKTKPMRKLIQSMPGVCKFVLDKCITRLPETSSAEKNCTKIRVYYELLEDWFSDWMEDTSLWRRRMTLQALAIRGYGMMLQTIGHGASDQNTNGRNETVYSNFNVDGTLHDAASIFVTDPVYRSQNHPLRLMLKTDESRELLNHPVVRLLLLHKHKATRPIYWMSFFLLLTLLILITGHCLVIPPPFYVQGVPEGNNYTWLADGQTRWEENLDPVALVLFGKVGFWIIFVLTVIYFVEFLYRFWMYRHSKCNSMRGLLSIFREIGVQFFTVLFILPGLGDFNYAYGVHFKPDWQWQIGAFAVFLAWFNFILFLQTVPFFGIYVLMFLEVLSTLLNFIFVVGVFLLAFAVVFCILLLNQAPFHTLGDSLSKTVAMLTGEIELSAVFHNTDYTYKPVASVDFTSIVFYPVSTHIIFVIFIIFMPILIMNLLTGLAVYDIEVIQTKAKMHKQTLEAKGVLDFQNNVFLFPWKASVVRDQVIPVWTKISSLYKLVYKVTGYKETHDQLVTFLEDLEKTGSVKFTKTTEMTIGDMAENITDITNRLSVLTESSVDAKAQHLEAMNAIQELKQQMKALQNRQQI